MKLVWDESGIGMKVVLDEIYTFGMKVILDELVLYRFRIQKFLISASSIFIFSFHIRLIQTLSSGFPHGGHW